MEISTIRELPEMLRSITSLISKSEKAQQKLPSGTWQHAMLHDNLKALYIASALMNNEHEMDVTNRGTRDTLHEALRAFASMISKTEKAQVQFLPGTSQYILLRNRLTALRFAEERIKVEVKKWCEPEGAR